MGFPNSCVPFRRPFLRDKLKQAVSLELGTDCELSDWLGYRMSKCAQRCIRWMTASALPRAGAVFSTAPAEYERGRELRRPTPFARDEEPLFSPANLRSSPYINPIDRDLIANGQKYSPVMLDLFVEFVALVAHGKPARTANRATLIRCLLVSTAGMGICSSALRRPLLLWC